MRFGTLSGSLTRLTNGTSYLVAGSNITITSGSTGAVTIAATGGGTPVLTLVETKTLSSSGTQTFSSLNGDSDKIYFLEGDITVGSGALIEIYPNSNSGNVVTCAYITNSSSVTSPSGGTTSKLQMPAGSSISSGERLTFWCKISADGRSAGFGQQFTVQVINDATPGGGAIRQQHISGIFTATPRANLTSLQVASTGGTMTGRLSLYKLVTA